MTFVGAAATAAPKRSACRCCSRVGGGPRHGRCDSLDVLSVIGMQVPAVRNKVMLWGGLPHTTLVRLPAAAVRESCDLVSAHTRQSAGSETGQIGCTIPIPASPIYAHTPGDLQKPRTDVAVVIQ